MTFTTHVIASDTMAVQAVPAHTVGARGVPSLKLSAGVSSQVGFVMLKFQLMCCAVLCCAGLSKSLKLHKDRGDPTEHGTPDGSRHGDAGGRDDSAKPRHQGDGTNGSDRKPQGPSYKLTGETGSYRWVVGMLTARQHCWQMLAHPMGWLRNGLAVASWQAVWWSMCSWGGCSFNLIKIVLALHMIAGTWLLRCSGTSSTTTWWTPPGTGCTTPS